MSLLTPSFDRSPSEAPKNFMANRKTSDGQSDFAIENVTVNDDAESNVFALE